MSYLDLMHPRLRKIEVWRRRMGISKSALARQAGVSRGDVAHLLYAPSPTHLRALEEAVTEAAASLE